MNSAAALKNESAKEIPIADTEIGTYGKKALHNAGFSTLNELKSLSKHDIKNLKGVGYASYKQIINELITRKVWDTPTVQEKEKQIGCKIFTPKEAESFFPKLEVGDIIAFLEKSHLRENYFVVGEDVIISSDEVGGIHRTKFFLPKNWLDSIKINWLELLDICNEYGYNLQIIKQFANDGLLDSALMYKDIYDKQIVNQIVHEIAIQQCVNLSEFMNKNETEWSSLKAFADEMGYNYQTLVKYSTQGLLQSARISETLWDKKILQKLIPKIASDKRLNMVGHGKKDYFGMLNQQQQDLINGYIEHKTNGTGTIYVSGHIHYSKKFSNQKVAEKNRQEIAYCFYRIICHKSGIDNYWEMNESNFRNLRSLTPEELVRFNPDLFNPLDFCSEDMVALQKGWKEGTKLTHKWATKPFFYWLLMEEELRVKKLLKAKSPLAVEEQMQLEIRKNDIFDAFIIYTPVGKQSLQIAEEDKNISIFLKRDQIIRLYRTVRFKGVLNGLRDPIKYATMLMMGFLTGVRPGEMIKLQLKDFWIDQSTFLLKTDEDGYGILNIPSDKSKGGYSPSHPVLKTLLPPRLVELLNAYINEFLLERVPHYYGEETYLFCANHQINLPYKKQNGIGRWIPKIKKSIDFLTPEEQKVFEEHFNYYDTRHTVYNLIVKYTTLSNRDLDKWQDRAAQIHCRHDISKKNGNMGWKHYSEDIDLETYKYIIDSALNFPWDLEELKEWEMNNSSMISQNSIQVSNEENKTDFNQNIPEAVTERIIEIKNDLLRIKNEIKTLNNTKGLSTFEKIEKAKTISANKSNLENELERLNNKWGITNNGL
jgi:integrase